MNDTRFWDRIAPKYAKSKIGNIPAYEATLTRVAGLLGQDDLVLEVGCGTGTTALKLCGGVAQYTASDISPGMIDIAREKARTAGAGNTEFTVAAAMETRFEPASFDAVLGFNLLHLVEDLPGAIARAHDLLKPGGIYVTKTPCLGQMGLHIRLLVPVMQFFGKAPFAAFFGAAELEKAIRTAGFDIVDARVFDGSPHSRFLVARKV